MALVFDPILNMPRNAGLTLRVTNNGDGTITFNWSGYNLTAVDEDGVRDIESSTDGENWTSATAPGLDDFETSWALPQDYGTTFYYRLVAYDSVLALLKTSNVVTVTSDYDVEAESLITTLTATDGWAGDATKEQAIHDLFGTIRLGGYLSKIVELFLPIFANATINRRKWITRTQMTFVDNGGTWSHNADGISKTGNAYINSGYAPANLGQTAAANGTGIFYKTFPVQNTACACGVQPSGAPNQVNIFPNYTGNTSFFRLGTDEAAGSYSVNTSALAAGILMGVRSSAANAAVYHYRWSNTTFSTVGSTTGLSGTTFPANTHNKFWFATNAAGTPAAISATPIYGGFESLALNATEAEAFAGAVHTLLLAFGITP